MTDSLTSALAAAVPSAVRTIARTLREAGFRVWAVGGCIRDELLAMLFPDQAVPPRNDWDLATDARPDRVQKLFRRVIPTGIKHGTVTVLVRGEGYEVTTLRGEKGYSDGRHPDEIYFVDDLKEDLARRDFTINAIAYDVLDDSLHDPFDGVGDLRRRLLRAVGDPAQRFAEDGLRVLRCARLAATLCLDIEETTRAAIEPSLESYRRVSAERIREEWFKALGAKRPSRAFEIMRDEGMLAITAPELLAQRQRVEPDFDADALTVSFRCVDLLPPDPVLRFSGLIHALDDAQARELASRLRLSGAEQERARAIVAQRRLPVGAADDDAVLRRWLKDVTRERVDDIFQLHRARLQAGHRAAPEKLAELDALAERVRGILDRKEPLTTRELAVSGRDLIEAGFRPGPALGRALNTLLDRVLEDPTANTRERLLDHARRLAGSAEPE